MQKKKRTQEQKAAVEELAREVRAALDGVMAQARIGDWDAASHKVLDLLHAARRVEIEVDYRIMSVWLDKAKDAA